MTIDTRNYMTRGDLTKAGAVTVAHVKNGHTVGFVMPEVLAQPGFYFMVKGAGENRAVGARFFVGNQRSAQGFNATLSHIRQGRSQLARTMASNNVVYEVLYLPQSKMKPLTTGFKKGQLALAFTRQHSSEMQTLSELNRILNDNFKFVLQSY
ncbi:TPA: naphthalene 1,2-dioxygenase [Klebsiella pneumoniae]